MVRPGPDNASMNGPLALAVLTRTTRRGASRCMNGSKSAAVMSGPGRLNLATFPSKLPCPISTTKIVSSGPALANLPNAFATSSRVDLAVIRFVSVSGFSCR